MMAASALQEVRLLIFGPKLQGREMVGCRSFLPQECNGKDGWERCYFEKVKETDTLPRYLISTEDEERKRERERMKPLAQNVEGLGRGEARGLDCLGLGLYLTLLIA
jgi:hypothetical protein